MIIIDLIKTRIQGKWKRSYIIEEYLKSAEIILEAGCGNGDIIQIDPKRIIGIDSNKESIDECHRKGLDATLANILDTGIKPEIIDAITCLQVIEHMRPEQAYQMLIEFERILKPGGKIVISTPMNTPEVWNTFTHEKPYTPTSLRKITEKDFGQENYPKITRLKVKETLYTSDGIIKTIIANFLPIFRKGHTTILQKTPDTCPNCNNKCTMEMIETAGICENCYKKQGMNL